MVIYFYLPHYDQKYWRPWNNRKHIHAFVPNIIVDFMEENGYNNIISAKRDLNHSFIVSGEKQLMGQLNEAIQIKNVLDFYDIKNFVETGTGMDGRLFGFRHVVEADEFKHSYDRSYSRNL